jgi:hypothetical protein
MECSVWAGCRLVNVTSYSGTMFGKSSERHFQLHMLFQFNPEKSWKVVENSTPMLNSHINTNCHYDSDLFTMPEIPEFVTYCCPTCGLKCCSNGGLTQHQKARHPKIFAPKEASQHKCIHHPHLTGDAPTRNSLQPSF